MDGTIARPGANSLAALVDDRAKDGVFRVDRSVYTDPAVFEIEMARIFESGWVFMCHESQVKKPGDYYATEIGRQPVYVHRQKDRSLKCFVNACSHRAAVLTPFKQGSAKVLTCRFHGWSYDSDGRCINIKGQESGFPNDPSCRDRFRLREIPRLASYRGFVFGSLVDDVPSIEEHLGAARLWIDLMVVQSTEGLEVVPGSSCYAIRGNWKFQAENSVDGYHVSTIHRVFANTIANRESKAEYTGMQRTEGGRITSRVATGAYDLGNGHMSIWATHTTPEVRPIYEQKERLDRELPQPWVDWILNRGRNLYLFPNVMLMDNPSTQIRLLKPIAPDRSEVTVYCIAPIGESKKARYARLRKFEDFYLTAGMATSDDIAALEETQVGSRAELSRWNEFHRGFSQMVEGADEHARKIGFTPASSSPDWDHETLFHGFYRHWLKKMSNGERA
jgi:benzoate/toluate 1,2-dioxygenase alpha subunit